MAEKAGIKTIMMTKEEFEKLSERVSALEKATKKLGIQNRKPRKQRIYTEEERKAIRARLLAGREAALKKQQTETKAAKKISPNKPGNAKAGEPEKTA
jgi:hypothetical protein